MGEWISVDKKIDGFMNKEFDKYIITTVISKTAVSAKEGNLVQLKVFCL